MPAPPMVIDPASYLTEDEAQTRWSMLKAGELRRARKRGLIEFYAFPTGPRFTAAAIQLYINQTYLRTVKPVAEVAIPLPLPRSPTNSPETVYDLPKEIQAAAAEACIERIRARRRKPRRKPPSAK